MAAFWIGASLAALLAVASVLGALVWFSSELAAADGDDDRPSMDW